MKNQLFLVLLAVYSLASVSNGQSTDREQDPTVSSELTALSDAADKIEENKELPGVALSESLSQITGIAISPLFGVSASGAWTYYQTPDDQRKSLSWYCSPIFWAPALILLGIFSLKTFLPNVLTKPLDVLDTFEDKISAAIATVGVVPSLALDAAKAFPTPPNMAHLSSSELFLASISFDYRLMFIPLGIAAFIVVWMTSHAITLLVVLSPFAIIDLGLKVLKISLMGTVLVSYLIHPILGAAVSLLFIGIATYLAPRVFRFSFFASLLSLDLLTPWRAKRTISPKNAHAFVSLKSLGVPKHTYGRMLREEDGSLVFTYRPRLIMKLKKIKIEGDRLILRRGILHPALLRSTELDGVHERILILPPRYRKNEHHVAEHLRITEIIDNTSVKGIKAAKAWLKDMMSDKSSRIEVASDIQTELK